MWAWVQDRDGSACSNSIRKRLDPCNLCHYILCTGVNTMVMLLRDYLYRFPPEILQPSGRCRVRIYKRENGSHTVLLTELANNTGESITSACERIAEDLVATHSLNPRTTRWIQNDLSHDGEQQEFDELKFVWTSGDMASAPQWQTLDAGQIEALTGDSPSSLSRGIGDLDSRN
jgi:hypothetical protein